VGCGDASAVVVESVEMGLQPTIQQANNPQTKTRTLFLWFIGNGSSHRAQRHASGALRPKGAKSAARGGWVAITDALNQAFPFIQSSITLIVLKVPSLSKKNCAGTGKAGIRVRSTA
jgi:hypothetical protein